LIELEQYLRTGRRGVGNIPKLEVFNRVSIPDELYCFHVLVSRLSVRAAIDGQRRSGDVLSFRARQKRYRIPNILSGAVPSQRNEWPQRFGNRAVGRVHIGLTDGPNARACVENLLLAAVESMPECAVTPAGCMVTLAAVSEECPGEIPDIIKSVRLNCLEMLRARLNDALVAGELPSTTDVDRLSRFYLGVYQGIAIQARDGATSAELKGVAETAMAAWPGIKANRKRRA
jgi:hypothetical protein